MHRVLEAFLLRVDLSGDHVPWAPSDSGIQEVDPTQEGSIPQWHC